MQLHTCVVEESLFKVLDGVTGKKAETDRNSLNKAILLCQAAESSVPVDMGNVLKDCVVLFGSRELTSFRETGGEDCGKACWVEWRGLWPLVMPLPRLCHASAAPAVPLPRLCRACRALATPLPQIAKCNMNNARYGDTKTAASSTARI